MRKKLDNILNNNKLYDYFMIVIILASLVPLSFKSDAPILRIIDLTTAVIFSIDYIARWLTTDIYRNRPGAAAFVSYPFTPMAIVDLLSILPSFLMINPAFKAFRLLRLIRALRVFRIIRYSKNVQILINVFKQERNALVAVGCLAVGYVFVSAWIMFQVEPNTFDTFFDAIYWATVSLTTVGYGDLYATSVIGRLLTMVSAFMGIAIVALPAGIITAGYMNEINKK